MLFSGYVCFLIIIQSLDFINLTTISPVKRKFEQIFWVICSQFFVHWIILMLNINMVDLVLKKLRITIVNKKKFYV